MTVAPGRFGSDVRSILRIIERHLDDVDTVTLRTGVVDQQTIVFQIRYSSCGVRTAASRDAVGAVAQIHRCHQLRILEIADVEDVETLEPRTDRLSVASEPGSEDSWRSSRRVPRPHQDLIPDNDVPLVAITFGERDLPGPVRPSDVADVESMPAALEGVPAPERDVRVNVGVADVRVEQACRLLDVTPWSQVRRPRIVLVSCQDGQRRR